MSTTQGIDETAKVAFLDDHLYFQVASYVMIRHVRAGDALNGECGYVDAAGEDIVLE